MLHLILFVKEVRSKNIIIIIIIILGCILARFAQINITKRIKKQKWQRCIYALLLLLLLKGRKEKQSRKQDHKALPIN